MANGRLDMASISLAQIALPEAQSGADSRTDRIASGLPGPLGTRIRQSLIVRPIGPFSTATSAERMRFCGMPKLRMAERMTHWHVEETAQTSHPEARRRCTNSRISGKMLGAIAWAK